MQKKQKAPTHEKLMCGGG